MLREVLAMGLVEFALPSVSDSNSAAARPPDARPGVLQRQAFGGLYSVLVLLACFIAASAS